MKATKLILAAVAAFVLMFAVSGLWHQVVLGDYYVAMSAAVGRSEPDLVRVGLGYAILAVLMAWVYPIGYRGGAPITEGARFGAVIGLLWILPWSVIISGIWLVDMGPVLVDSAWHIVEQGLGGIAVALVYGQRPPRA